MHIGTDNRLFERVEGELAVRYSPQGSDREYCTNTKNISGGGIKISLLKKLARGTILDIEIFKYGQDFSARCRGKIVWLWENPLREEISQSFEAGIQFLEPKLLYLGRLINYLESQNKTRYYTEEL